MAAHEPEALVDDVEDAGGVGVAGALGLALEDAIDESSLRSDVDLGLELEVLADGPELRLAHRAEIGDVEVVPLASGLDLLHLVELAHGRAHRALGSTTRTTVTGTLIALVGTDGRHMGRTHEWDGAGPWARAELLRCAGLGGNGVSIERLLGPRQWVGRRPRADGAPATGDTGRAMESLPEPGR